MTKTYTTINHTEFEDDEPALYSIYEVTFEGSERKYERQPFYPMEWDDAERWVNENGVFDD